eukprot:s1820_g20.t1
MSKGLRGADSPKSSEYLTPAQRSTLYWRNARISPRSEEQISAAVDRWHCYLHPRARRVFALEQIDSILAQIARSVNADEDPIAPGTEDCVLWHGDLSLSEQSQLQAAICVVNKDRSKTIGFANRGLACF